MKKDFLNNCPLPESAEITPDSFEKAFCADDVQVLSLAVNTFSACVQSRYVTNCINGRLNAITSEFYRGATRGLYPLAVQNLRDSVCNDYPFREFETVLDFQITYNEKCHLSYYYDRYEYTGGAHGSTVRRSDSWCLVNAKRLRLADFFERGRDGCKVVIAEILKLADKRQQEKGDLFEDYQELIAEYFNPCSFYLTSDGITFYFQQYQIAPYSSGIIGFTLPYSVFDCPPVC